MRAKHIFSAAALSLAITGATHAAEIGPVSEIRINFGKDVQEKPKIIGQREKDRLEAELRGEVLKAVGGLQSGGGVLELTIEDASPNRPTFTQMSYQPNLSYLGSFGIGGASIEGAYVAPTGARTPLKYRWYESDIRQSQYGTDWADADRAFTRFARTLKTG